MTPRSLMRSLVGLAMFFLPLALMAQESVTLDAGWLFRQARLQNWHEATVPGTVQTDSGSTKRTGSTNSSSTSPRHSRHAPAAS